MPSPMGEFRGTVIESHEPARHGSGQDTRVNVTYTASHQDKVLNKGFSALIG